MSNDFKKPLIYKRSDDTSETELKPIVLNYRALMKKKEKDQEENGKKKYSRGLKDVQEAEADLVRLARRTSKALSKGLDTYDRERIRSANEKKDGAIEDIAHNSAKAISDSLKEVSDILIEFADTNYAKNFQKRLRRSLKRTVKSLRVFRL